MKDDLKSIIEKLESRKPNPPLNPKSIWSEELNSKISPLKVNDVIKSGLYLWNDDIDRAHKLAQEINNSEGSYWHAILHRREGDYSNSKYWYRQADNHPIFQTIKKEFTDWDPFKFVDLCSQSLESGKKEMMEKLETIQFFEIKTLLNYVIEKCG